MAQLPRNEVDRIQAKKESKWVQYDTLAQIPEQIRRDADRNSGVTRKATAVMIRNSLLMAFLTRLPWRQRNIRELTIAPFASGGNLYKEEIPAQCRMAKSQWVEEALRTNPRERFWQCYFRPHETKTGCLVRLILPRQLVPSLEEYLDNHRAVLLDKHRDPGTLFFTGRGRPFCRKGILRIVGDLTMKYASIRVNPHLIRDIFAVRWLEDHPEDYLTLSKILWHSNVNTTIRIYGRGFDESHGARAAQRWLDKRNGT